MRLVKATALSLVSMIAWRIAHAAIPLANIQYLSAGGYQTCAIAAGAAQCWGADTIVGIEAPEGFIHSLLPVTKPLSVPGLSSGVSRIAVGLHHTCAIDLGQIRCWGYDDAGQLGLGGAGPSYQSVTLPTAVFGSDGATEVAAGTQNSCAVISGAAWCWGDDAYGQLGNSSVVTGLSTSPVIVEGLTSGVTRIAVASSDGEPATHACAIVNGEVWCWGSNSFGELGRAIEYPYQSTVAARVTGLDGIATDLALGYQHTCAVVDGAAYCWGANCAGQLGSSNVPAGCPGGYSATPVVPDGLGSDVDAIAANYNHTCALVKNDKLHPVKCWGNNSSGQIGSGSVSGPPGTTDHPVDVALSISCDGTGSNCDVVTGIVAGSQHVCASIHKLSGSDYAYCWGDNEPGQLGANGGGAVLVPQPGSAVPGISAASTLGAGPGAKHVCAVVGGAASCWGYNDYNQLGDGLSGRLDRSLPYPVSGLETGTSQIAAGIDVTCAVVNESAMCWGSEEHGELGNGHQYYSSNPAAVPGLGTGVTKIAIGGADYPEFDEVHVCAIVNGGVQCWGANSRGQLGSDQVATDYYSYSAAPVVVTGLDASSGVTDIAAGDYSSCAIVGESVQCWGKIAANASYPLGSPVPATVSGISGAVAITLGAQHACAVVSGGVQCWGDNSFGQLGNGQAGCCSSATPSDVNGLPPGSGVTSISAGRYHTCAVVSGAVKCWGLRIGTAALTSYPVPVEVPGLAEGVVQVVADGDSECARLGDGTVNCWGNDYFGQLGDGRVLIELIPQTVVKSEIVFSSGFGG